jgi:hypothetical protein
MPRAQPSPRAGEMALFGRPVLTAPEPSAVLLAGMMVLAADGRLVNLADTPAGP